MTGELHQILQNDPSPLTWHRLLQHRYWRLEIETGVGRGTLWPGPTIPLDRANQAGYNPTHFAKAL